MTFWATEPGKPTLEQKRAVAEKIIEASGPMPDARGHLLWLLTLHMESLQDRLRQIAGETGWTAPRRLSLGHPAPGRLDFGRAISDEMAQAIATK